MRALRLGWKDASSLRRCLVQRDVRALQSLTRPAFHTRAFRPIQSRDLHLQTTRRSITRTPNSSPLRQPRRWKSDDAVLDSKPESELTLGQRMKKLSRDYGWAAFYVYMGLTALDLPFCYLAVKLIGPETVGHWEHVIVTYVKAFLQWPLAGGAHEQVVAAVDKIAEVSGAEDGKRLLEEDSSAQKLEIEDHGYREAEAANRGKDASLWTTLALAYALHKSFIFVRIPLAASITPKVVKTLRGWGWNIGRPTTKALKKSPKSSGTTEVNTKGSGVKPDA